VNADVVEGRACWGLGAFRWEVIGLGEKRKEETMPSWVKAVSKRKVAVPSILIMRSRMCAGMRRDAHTGSGEQGGSSSVSSTIRYLGVATTGALCMRGRVR